MGNVISKPMPEKFTDKYFVYNGCDTMEEMIENIEYLKQDKAKCYFINLNNQFYAVFFESFEKEIIVGKERVFFNKNGRLNETSIREAKIGFRVSQRAVKWITDTLARELNFLYPDLKMYEYPTVKSSSYRQIGDEYRLSNYVVLLGLTFASKWYTLKNVEDMITYFKNTSELISFLRRTKGAVAIDPFSQEVRFKDGSIGTYKYFRRPHGYFQYIADFALEQKNKYSTFRKREWISIARYQALYPNDDIIYDVPDYRDDKNSCKWCGGKLPEGKKSYCCVECRMKYTEKVIIERGALLPYMILCRDNFTCQVCGKTFER